MTTKSTLQFTVYLLNGMSDSRITLIDQLYFQKIDYRQDKIAQSIDHTKVEQHLLCTFIPLNLPMFPHDILTSKDEVAAARVKVVTASTKDGYPPIVTAAATFNIPVLPDVTLGTIGRWELRHYMFQEAVHWQWDFDYPVVPTPLESFPSINTYDDLYILYHGIKS